MILFPETWTFGNTLQNYAVEFTVLDIICPLHVSEEVLCYAFLHDILLPLAGMFKSVCNMLLSLREGRAEAKKGGFESLKAAWACGSKFRCKMGTTVNK